MMKRNNQRRRSKGFTLIEILIVILIIGVLAGIVIASFSATPRDSRISTIRSSLKVVRAQIELYHYHHGYPDSIDTLHDEGYLANRAIAPEGFVYQYDPNTGAFWVECTPGNNDCPDDIGQW
jgi:prepilin-type N-terminal cleavage/methylation domain-containing protein